jgi:DNA polymerase IIIc chi subunit
MATEVNFYHLTKASHEDALPRLLQKTLQAGERAVNMLQALHFHEFFKSQALDLRQA